jgi:hypothetical protein
VGKIHLPVHGREASSGLVHGKGRGPNIGVRICMLTDRARLGDLFKILLSLLLIGKETDRERCREHED